MAVDEESGMGGSKRRSSSNDVLSESRRFCSASLCVDLIFGPGRDDMLPPPPLLRTPAEVPRVDVPAVLRRGFEVVEDAAFTVAVAEVDSALERVAILPRRVWV